ncbi:MAG: hypothetical protein U5N58_07040 [Actinomycetota bacterium]|nr:hypothetical protein [Actinomycetota bacterium]
MELKIYVLVPLLGFIFGLFLAAYRFRTAFYILNLVVFVLLGWISFQLHPGPAEFNIRDKAGFEAGGG